MEIIWYGHSCFRLIERGLDTVVVDPYDHNEVGYKPHKIRADIVAISNDTPGHNYTQAIKGANHTITGPGEYEIGGVFITAVQADKKQNKNLNGSRNTMYVFDYDGLTIAHMGNLIQTPTQSEVEALGTVNIALIPVGGGEGLTAAKAAEIVSQLEPNIVIPMQYKTKDSNIELDPLEKFIKEMGLQPIEPIQSLKISKTGLPSESKVIVLDYKSD